MQSPLVSIIIPVYNGEKYIEKCKTCMMHQTYKNIEIIVVNDGSRDNSLELLKLWADNDDRVVVVNQENKGLSGARNAGIFRATGKYVFFYDVDDEIIDTTIEDNVSLAEQYNADLVLFCFWYYYVDADELQENTLSDLFVGSKEEFFRNKLIETMDHEIFNAPWNKLVKKSVLDDNSILFDERFPIYEDIVFAPKVLGASSKIVINNKAYYKYYVRSSGSLITRFFENFFESITEYYDQAIKYCNLFSNNDEQIRRMSYLYVVLGIFHIKQISIQPSIDKRKKIKLIDNICNNEKYRDALDLTKLPFRKKIVRALVKGRRSKLCYLLYSLQNKERVATRGRN